MRSLIYSSIILILALYSCNSRDSKKVIKDDKISIIGKWYRFSIENGYSEFDIDSQYVVLFNQKTGRSMREYKIENDSFKFFTYKYSAKFIFYGDSIYFKGNDNTTATLYRFSESDVPFESIPDENDPSMKAFEKAFDERAIREWEKAGIIFLDR